MNRAATDVNPSGRRRRTAAFRPLLALALVLVALSACSGVDEDLAVEEGVPAERAPAPEAEDAAGVEDGADPGDGAEDRLLVREGEVVVRTDGDFDRAYAALSALVGDLDGRVTAVESSERDGRVRGRVTVGVPVDRFDELLAGVAEFGAVLSRRVGVVEVTGEAVDLASRLRHLERQESFYLGLFDDAEDVDDALAIAPYLDEVQERIEQTRGRLEALERAAATSTLTVEFIPPGEPFAASGWIGVGQDARAAFVNVAGGLLIGLAGLSPFLLLLLLVGLPLLIWLRHRRQRRAVAPDLPPPSEPVPSPTEPAPS